MRIIIVGQFGLESFGLHISDTLKKMGHTVVARIPFNRIADRSSREKISFISKAKSSFNDRLLFAKRESRNHIMNRIMSTISSLKCDLIICTKDYFLDYEIKEIKRKSKARIVMWYPDHMVSFGRAPFVNAGYDALFFKDTYIIKELRQIYELPAFYLPECYNPIRHKRIIKENELDKKEFECDISIIGNLHSFRVAILNEIKDFDVKAYGTAAPWWINTKTIQNCYTGRYLAYVEKAKAIHYSKINLNNLYIGEVEGVNVRAFEIAGMGGFQLLEWKSGLHELFEEDKELVAYKSIEELREKARYYINHEEQRKKIAEAGYQRAVSEHTYEHRLNRLFNLSFNPVDDEHTIYDYHALADRFKSK